MSSDDPQVPLNVLHAFLRIQKKMGACSVIVDSVRSCEDTALGIVGDLVSCGALPAADGQKAFFLVRDYLCDVRQLQSPDGRRW